MRYVYLGIPIPNISGPVGRDAIEAVARKADEVGLHSVWLGDHIVWPAAPSDQRPGESLSDAKYAGDLYEAFTTAAYVSALTHRVKIGLGVVVAPYRNLLVTAKMVSTLDNLSEGRVILGVGTGYVGGEFRALGVPQRRTGEITDDLIDLLRMTCESDLLDFVGQTMEVRNAIFRPQPVQNHLPVWVGGNSEAAMHRAIRAGDGWQSAGLSLEQLREPVTQFRRFADNHNRSVASLAVSGRLRVRFDTVPFIDETGDDRHIPHDRLRPHLMGPPAFIAEQLLRFEEELGVDHLLLNLHEDDPLDKLLAAIDVLGSKVLPHL